MNTCNRIALTVTIQRLSYTTYSSAKAYYYVIEIGATIEIIDPRIDNIKYLGEVKLISDFSMNVISF